MLEISIVQILYRSSGLPYSQRRNLDKLFFGTSPIDMSEELWIVINEARIKYWLLESAYYCIEESISSDKVLRNELLNIIQVPEEGVIEKANGCIADKLANVEGLVKTELVSLQDYYMNKLVVFEKILREFIRNSEIKIYYDYISTLRVGEKAEGGSDIKYLLEEQNKLSEIAKTMVGLKDHKLEEAPTLFQKIRSCQSIPPGIMRGLVKGTQIGLVALIVAEALMVVEYLLDQAPVKSEE